MKPDLSINIAGICMKNPVMVASGTFGYGEEYKSFFDLTELGAIVTKSITLFPKAGNSPPRIYETPSGMLNAIGLQNVGLERFVNEKMPFLRSLGIPVIVSISGEEIDEYVELASELSNVDGISGIEINISCPNVAKGGMVFGSEPSMTYELVKSVRSATSLPIIVKLSPNVTNISKIASSAENAGANVISLINTLLGMAVDIHTRRPRLKNITGGLSGPAIRPIAIRMVWQVKKSVNLPIIGMGGIMNAEDALEFIITGANAVAIGTANFVNPVTAKEVISGIENFLVQNNLKSINELVGTLNISNSED